ncbi:MAG: type II/IV secretion system protein [Sedimentisphaerales bacterium]|nr:type II/IV secretion system protein [Sedimentisphaerales bacterium]
MFFKQNDKSPDAQGPQVVTLVHDLLTQAVTAHASDVHFEPMADAIFVKFRLDGQLQTIETFPAAWSQNMVTRLKVLGGLLTYRNDIPQEGHIVWPDCDDLRDMRLSVFPTIHGQRAVVRLFYRRAELFHLDQLGFSPAMGNRLKQLAGQTQGIILLTGPAGSGKSTTLAAMLRFILSKEPGKSIVALEDPVEQQIDGVTQVQIPPHGEMTFPVALRSLLRQDPQVLMLGEIRDAQTARIAIEAGLTGHLLLSTLHGGSCATALLRLLEMGIEPYQVTSSVIAVLNQRLVRCLCPACKKPDAVSGCRSVGCSACYDSGYQGRRLIAELVELDGDLRRALLDRCELDELQNNLLRRGHMTLRQDGQRLVADGITSREELNRICPEE